MVAKSEDVIGVPIFQASLDLLELQGNEFKIGVAPTEPQLEQFHDKPLRLSILKLGKRPRILLRHARGKQRARKEAPDRFRRPPDAPLNHVRSRCRLGSFQTLHHVRVRQNIVGTREAPGDREKSGVLPPSALVRAGVMARARFHAAPQSPQSRGIVLIAAPITNL